MTEDMKKLLNDMIGKHFHTYECTKDDKFNRTYGNIRLYLDELTLEITNEEHPAIFFDEPEDISYFECHKVDSSKLFEPDLVSEVKKYPVNKLVTGVEIIKDQIDVGNGQYSFSFDQAIIIHMDKDILMLSRDVWFSELIKITANDEYDELCPISDVVDTMNCNGEYEVKVNRSRTAL